MIDSPFIILNEAFLMLDESIRDVLAANLRRLRIARELSLSELARATSMSKATLSSIENGRANPTITTLSALADALRVPLGELLEELPLGEIRVVRAAQARVDQSNGVPRRALGTVAGTDLAEISVPPGTLHESDALGPGARAHVYVIQGKLIAGPVARVTELGPGDYISFPADVPYQLEARRQLARALVMSEVPR
jgi:transcriptional regulator with XRE-family HTH domain